MSPATAQELARSGKDGAALDRLLGQDPSSAAKDGGSKAPAAGSDREAATPAAPSENPLDAVRRSLTSGSTIGSGFAWAFVLSALVMAGWGWTAFRRRRSA